MAAVGWLQRAQTTGTVAAVLVASALAVVADADPVAAAPPAPAACAAGQPDEAAAARTAAACKRPVEILSERTEYAQVFRNADGTLTLSQSAEPQQVRRGSAWVPVDTTLTRTAGGIAPRATVLPMTFSAGGTTLIGRLRDGDHDLAVTWPSKLPAPVLDRDTAVYADVLPGVDLRVTAQATGFSEVLVVHDAKAAANPEVAKLRFGLSGSGVAVRRAPGGGLEARDSKGVPVFRAPAPLMWDSSETPQPTDASGPGRSADSARSRQAVMPVKLDGGNLTLVPDKRMLADPRTKYPLYIDPSVSGRLVNNEWTSVWSKHPTSSFWKNTTALTNGSTYGSAGAGRTEDCTGCADHIVRSLFRMNTAPVKGTHITKAVFSIEQRHAWTCNPATNAKLWLTGGFSSATTWKNQPTWNSSYVAYGMGDHKVGSVHGCKGPGPVEFNVQSMVALGAAKGWTSVSLGLRANNEATLLQWKRFNPSTANLSITYNRPPNALDKRKADGQDCAVAKSPRYVLWTNPTLTGYQSDPDKQNLTTDFYWWPKGGSRTEANKVSQANSSNATVSKQIPAGRLADGGTYVWQAKTSDGSLATWSGTCEFTVDSTPPPPPGGLSSPTYSATAPSGGVGITGTFTIAAPATRPHEVAAYAWTLDSGVLLASQTVPVVKPGYTGVLTTAPLHDGINTLRVWSKDHAGRFSTTPVTYTFTVRAGTGPAAEWTFDEAAGDATDISQHGNTAVLSGSAARTAGRGGIGSAASLNGTSASVATAGAPTYPHPDTGVATAVRTNTSFTVSARVKLTSTTGVTGQRTAVAASGSQTSAYALGYSGADNRWRFAMAGSDAAAPQVFQVLSNAAPAAGKWTHLAAVYDATTKKLTLYVNGVAQTATVTLTGGFNATGPVTIGKRRWAGADDGFLNGAVDDVRVYSYAETAGKLAVLALPLQPAVALPGGEEVTAGGSLPVTLSAGGDTNVTKFRYSLGDTTLSSTATPTAAGGSVTVTLPVGTVTGERPLYVVAVDDSNRAGPMTQIQLTVNQKVNLTGTVLDVSGLPASGAAVKVQPGGATATTDAEGSFAVAGLAPGVYTVTASAGGRCGLLNRRPFEITSQGLNLELYLVKASSTLGHTCAERTSAFATGTTVLPLTGDNAVTTMDLPFAFPFYGGAYRSLWVDTNGLLSFTDPLGSHPHTAGGELISAAEPNAVIAPFWDDLVVDASAAVRTTVTAGQAVIEWRNVHRKGNTGQRLSFSATLAADGTVTTNYDALDNAAEQGSSALVGIESLEGEDGFAYSADEASLVGGKAVVFTPPDITGGFETHNLSGTLTDAAGQPVAGATVQLDPSGLSTTTAANGSYTFFGLVADSYTVTTRKAGRCEPVAGKPADLTADTVLDLQLGPDHGEMGYACTLGAAGFVPAGTVLPLTGDDAETDVTLPFPMSFYGRSATIATVSTNGWVGVGGGYLEAFWGDLVVDGAASVRTQSTGTAPNRSFVVEWRNVQLIGTAERTTFEVVLRENGTVTYQYGALSTDLQKGGNATVGLEALAGRVTDYYSTWEPLLTANSSITWTPAGAGAVTGVLTEAVTTEPIAGVTITLNPGSRTVTTGPDGGFSFTGVVPGSYQLLASRGDDRCLGQYATATVLKTAGDAQADLSLNNDADQYHHCTITAQPFIAAGTVQNWTGDDGTWRTSAPFPLHLYGETSTDLWVSSNGFVSFAPEGGTDAATTPIPSGAVDGTAAGAVYAFWADWVIDDKAAIATGVSGTAPHRQYVVEWRNAALHGNDAVRVSFEVIFDEDGGLTLAYDGIDPDNPVERGAEGAVGIENTDGSVGFQHLYAADVLTDGVSVHFQPDAPARNSVTGTVTCADNPVEGATVTAAGITATTAYDGTYLLEGVPAKTWSTVATITGGECAGSTARSVLVGRTAPRVDFALRAATGYAFTETPVPYTALTGTDLLTGHDAWADVQVPFPVELYGSSTQTISVGSEGTLALPTAYLYPFRGDWEADAQSDVLAAVRGAAPNRQYVIEWRNVRHHGDATHRFDFQAIFDEAGGISFVYPDNDGSYLQSGGMALIGMQPTDGTDPLLYADRQAVLRPGFGLRITPAIS